MIKKALLLCVGLLACTLISCDKNNDSPSAADRITGTYTCSFNVMGMSNTSTVKIAKETDTQVTVSLPSFTLGTDIVSISLAGVKLTEQNNTVALSFNGVASYTFNGQTMQASNINLTGTVGTPTTASKSEFNAVVNITLAAGASPLPVTITGSR